MLGFELLGLGWARGSWTEGMEGLRCLEHTVRYPIYMYLTEVELLRVGAERNFGIAEEVFADLRLAGSAEVLFIAIDGSSGSVEFDDGCGVADAYPLAVEAAEHVAVEPFRAYDDQDVDYGNRVLACQRAKQLQS